MPDLGIYTTEVLSAYGVGLLLLVGLVALSILERRAAKRALKDFEQDD